MTYIKMALLYMSPLGQKENNIICLFLLHLLNPYQQQLY